MGARTQSRKLGSRMRYKVSKANAFWRILDDEAVIISAATSRYYSLNRTGTFVWNLLAEEPLSAAELAARVASHYDVALESAAADVDAILADLCAEELVERS